MLLLAAIAIIITVVIIIAIIPGFLTWSEQCLEKHGRRMYRTGQPNRRQVYVINHDHNSPCPRQPGLDGAYGS